MKCLIVRLKYKYHSINIVTQVIQGTLTPKRVTNKGKIYTERPVSKPMRTAFRYHKRHKN